MVKDLHFKYELNQVASVSGNVPVIYQNESSKTCVILLGPMSLDLVLNALWPRSLPHCTLGLCLCLQLVYLTPCNS